MKRWFVLGALHGACGGGGSGPTPVAGVQVNQLQANKSITSLGVPVTFTVRCTRTHGSDTSLTYQWHYGDEPDPAAITDTTSVATATHAYGLKPGSPVLNHYDTYQYSVTCLDNSQPTATARASAQSIKVLREDLSLSPHLCSSGAPGLGWCWQSPLPGGEGLSAVAAASDQIAWAAGDFGTVLRTVDGGSNWLPRYLGGSVLKLPLLKSINARDADHAWVVGVEGSFWATADGGKSWPRGAPTTPLQLIGVAAPDAAHAFGVSGTTLFTTTDAGANWSGMQLPGIGAGDRLFVVAALDKQNVFVAGTSVQNFEMESSDGGAHWSTPLILQNGLTQGVNPQTLSVTRGDSSTGAQRAAGGTVSAFDGRTAWLSDFATPTILATKDSLQSLASVGSPFPLYSALNAFDTADCRTGWAVGPLGEIARTYRRRTPCFYPLPLRPSAVARRGYWKWSSTRYCWTTSLPI